MSRLIDADALKQELGYIDAIPAVTERDIDNAPTIPAIPIDWLETQVRGEDEGLAKAALRVLRAWNGEQEAR